MPSKLARALLGAAFMLAAFPAWSQENIRGATTGPTTAPGFSHAEQYLHLQDVKPAENMYPVVPHPEQDKAARDKLAALEAKTQEAQHPHLPDGRRRLDGPRLQRRRRRGR